MATATLEMDKTKAEELIKLLTDGLVNIDDKDGTFTYTSELGDAWITQRLNTVVPDGKTPLNTVVWTTWEWTQGVALTALYRVSLSPLLSQWRTS